MLLTHAVMLPAKVPTMLCSFAAADAAEKAFINAAPFLIKGFCSKVVL